MGTVEGMGWAVGIGSAALSWQWKEWVQDCSFLLK